MKTITIVLVSAAIFTSLFIAYTGLISVPRERMEAQEQAARAAAIAEEERELLREEKYLRCTRGAYYDYSANWDSECERRGLGKDCTLPGAYATKFEDRKREAEKDCIAMYK